MGGVIQEGMNVGETTQKRRSFCSALGCLDVIVPKVEYKESCTLGLCCSKVSVSNLVPRVFSKHKLDGDAMKFREVLHPENCYSCVFEGGLGSRIKLLEQNLYRKKKSRYPKPASQCTEVRKWNPHYSWSSHTFG